MKLNTLPHLYAIINLFLNFFFLKLHCFKQMTGLESVIENENSATAFLYLIALAIRKYV